MFYLDKIFKLKFKLENSKMATQFRGVYMEKKMDWTCLLPLHLVEEFDL